MKFEGFRPKTTEELENQAQKSQEILGEKIYPPDISSSDTLDISNIKTEYKTRYDSYLQALRAEKKGELDTKEIQHAKEWIKALNNLDNYIKEHESKDNPLLREKQYVVYKKIRDFLEQGKREGYIKLPTGTGKTLLFSKIAEALNMKTFIAVPSVPLVGQTESELDEHTDSEFGSYYAKNKDLNNKVTVITYASMVNVVKNKVVDPEDIPVLILDEAHRSLGPERVKTIDQFSGLKLGFSATTEFSKDKKVSHLLEEEIFRMDVADGIREGLICQTQTIHAYTNVDISKVKINKGEYDKESLEKAINIGSRNIAAFKLYQEKFSNLKLFCNCSGVAHAESVAKMFNDQGIAAACITGKTPEGDKEGQRGWIFKHYKEGSIKVLTNARVLLEGFNEPSCSVTFNLHPTLSLVDAEQRARSGRLNEKDPEKWNYVVDFIDQNAKKPQVLYSEILGSDKVWDISNSNKNLKPASPPIDPAPPINLNNFSVDGLQVVVDSQKIMEITKSNSKVREHSENMAPFDWLTAQDISLTLNYPYHAVRDLVKEYSNTHPDWIAIYKGKNNAATEHCSPECIAEITKELNRVKEAQPGWMNLSQISSSFNLNSSTVKNFINKYRDKNTEWFENAKSSIGVSEFYSPDLITLVKVNLIKDTILTKPNWKTIRALREEVGGGIESVENIALKYKTTNPEWFEKQKTKEGKIVEHYAPELVEIIKKEKLKNKNKEGWFNASLLRDVLHISDITIKKFVEQFRGSHPDWFNMAKAGSKISEHYHPDLVKEIEKKYKIQAGLSNIPEGEGWMTATKLTKDKVGDYEAIKKFANTFRSDHPDWFKNYKTPKIAEHYHKDLVLKIQEHFRKLKEIPLPKEGWLTSYTLAKEVGRDTITMKNFVEQFRDKHSNWFEIAKAGNMNAEHYSPELVKIIRQNFIKGKRGK